MGADEVELELFEFVGLDLLAGERTEAGVDAVVGEAVVEDRFEPGSAGGDGVAGLVAQFDVSALACDRLDLLGAQGGVGLEDDVVGFTHGARSKCLVGVAMI